MLTITRKTYWRRSIFWCGDPNIAKCVYHHSIYYVRYYVHYESVLAMVFCVRNYIASAVDGCGRKCLVVRNDHILQSAFIQRGQRCHVVISPSIPQLFGMGAAGGALLLAKTTFHRVLPFSAARDATLV